MIAAFRDYMKAMGFNGKQVGVAAETIGLSKRAGIERTMGVTPIKVQDRLAMSAKVAGLPPWSDKMSEFLDDDARAAFRLASREMKRIEALAAAQVSESSHEIPADDEESCKPAAE